ncbi:MAG: glycosyltransferase, partial [Candidatus Aenigmarchaeota archaeon]|nr:glycosyltransferase [Candidatus Aenigmarchaeota archaeon]
LVFAQTKIMADEVRKEYPSVKIEVVPNMVEKGTANNEKKEYDVIFVGNLMKRKGVDNLISAAGDINGKVMIVGNGYERERLEKMVYDLDLKGRVVLKGKVDRSEILKEISKAKVLVLPSVSGEGMPNVILEAYSCGVPVVASSIAGIPDIVVDGKTGYLAKPGDVSELAEKINHLLEDDRYQLMKGNCIKFASKYYPEKIVPKIEKIYKRFL